MAETLERSPEVRELIESLRALEPELRALGVTSLALFGSRARGDHRDDSDVDLLIDIREEGKFSLFDLVGVSHVVGDRLGLPAHVELRSSLGGDLARRVEADLVRVF